jgi:hypothetical protein
MEKEFTKTVRVILAYILASVGSVILGWVTGLFWEEWSGTGVNFKLWICLVWILVVGISSALAMVEYLMKQLGANQRPSTIVRVANDRLIPIGPTSSVSNFNYILDKLPNFNQPASVPAPTVNLHEIELQIGDFVLSEEFITNFLRTAWSRQRNRKPPLSRPWWVEGGHLERGEYEAVMQALDDCALITGRTKGRSGKLRYPPARALSLLRDELGTHL